jgi:hypothetical protein
MFVWSAGLAQRLFLLFQFPSIHLSIHTDLLSRERAKAWYDFWYTTRCFILPMPTPIVMTGLKEGQSVPGLL